MLQRFSNARVEAPVTAEVTAGHLQAQRPRRGVLYDQAGATGKPLPGLFSRPRDAPHIRLVPKVVRHAMNTLPADEAEQGESGIRWWPPRKLLPQVTEVRSREKPGARKCEVRPGRKASVGDGEVAIVGCPP